MLDTIVRWFNDPTVITALRTVGAMFGIVAGLWAFYWWTKGESTRDQLKAIRRGLAARVERPDGTFTTFDSSEIGETIAAISSRRYQSAIYDLSLRDAIFLALGVFTPGTGSFLYRNFAPLIERHLRPGAIEQVKSGNSGSDIENRIESLFMQIRADLVALNILNEISERDKYPGGQVSTTTRYMISDTGKAVIRKLMATGGSDDQKLPSGAQNLQGQKEQKT